jgi:hypothetical protein
MPRQICTGYALSFSLFVIHNVFIFLVVLQICFHLEQVSSLSSSDCRRPLSEYVSSTALLRLVMLKMSIILLKELRHDFKVIFTV